MRRNRIILMILWILSLIFITVSGTQTAYGFFILLTMILFCRFFIYFWSITISGSISTSTATI